MVWSAEMMQGVDIRRVTLGLDVAGSGSPSLATSPPVAVGEASAGPATASRSVGIGSVPAGNGGVLPGSGSSQGAVLLPPPQQQQQQQEQQQLLLPFVNNAPAPGMGGPW